jgi:eukaryotic-like serine/threonine-protein kinase
MGEVYRARDPRMSRDVAIKVLPETFVQSAERRERFEQEARTTGGLNHPNLLVVHDDGVHDGVPFIVSELLEGETLRQRLDNGAIAGRKGMNYAVQIATGLAAAHERGVVHRDLKPENIFITTDDRVKLLDFGLAKVLHDASDERPNEATIPRQTNPGAVMGTPAYMAPEQVRGETLDARADIFSFGVILAEIVTGAHPFQRNSSMETMGAILNLEPSFSAGSMSGGMERIIQHALEKQPSRRFQTMKDVLFALDMLSGSGDSAPQTHARTRAPKQTEKKVQEVALQRVTFRRGFILTARFAPDGSVIYGAAWEDESLQLYSSYPGNPESRPFGLPDTDILAISRQGDLAVSLGRHFDVGWVTAGTLARMPLAGGVPREVCENMQDADWSPDGKTFAIIRAIGNSFSIEYPIGHQILETEHWISHLRLSPKNNMLAFLDHPIYGDDAGRLTIIDLNGKRIVESPTVWSSTSGVCWTPKGDEVWLAGERRMVGRDLIAVSLSGKERVVLPAPGRLTLHDISSQGQVLVSYDNARREIIAGHRGDTEERNLTWFDWSFPTALSRDGEKMLFEEQGAGRRCEANSIYLRTVRGAPAVYLGDGRARALSSDGKWIVVHTGKGGHFEILPTGAGQPRVLHADWIESPVWWHWFPDGKRLLVWGNEPGKRTRIYQVNIDTGQGRPVGPDETRWPMALSSDGKEVVAIGPDGEVTVYAIDGDEARVLAGSRPGEHPIQWSDDGKYIYVYRRGRLRTSIDRIDVQSGERVVWQDLKPNDPAGVMDIMPVYITPSGESYAYSFRRYLSELYIVSGLL